MTREERSDAIGSVRLAVDSTSGWLRTESWSSITDGPQAKVLRAHAAPQGMCDNLIDALKFKSNQQNDGDSPSHDGGPGLPRKNSAQNNGPTQKVRPCRLL